MEKKYQTVYDIDEANKLVELGYKLHTFFAAPVEGDFVQSYYVMSLSSEKIYDDISNLKDVTPEEVDDYLAKGWIIADSWSKLIRMVKKNDGNRGV